MFSSTKPSMSKCRPSHTQWLRSTSEPGPAKSGDPPAQHPSSDDYPDHEIVELLANSDALGNSLLIPSEANYLHKAGEPMDLGQRSSSEDTFETPPTTPPSHKHPSIEPSRNRKRSYPEAMRAPPSRNVSRKTFNDTSIQEVSVLIYFT